MTKQKSQKTRFCLRHHFTLNSETCIRYVSRRRRSLLPSSLARCAIVNLLGFLLAVDHAFLYKLGYVLFRYVSLLSAPEYRG